MKSEPKAFASLSSGLLARKGTAKPAMRPQGFSQTGAGLEDLGWNDMGFEPLRPNLAPIRDEDHDAFGEELGEQPLRNPAIGLTPVQSPVHDQQAEIAERFHAAPSEDDEEYDETAELSEPEEPIEFSRPIAFEPEIEPAASDEVDVPEPSLLAQKPRAIAAPAAQQVLRVRSAPGGKAKAAFTLRLDPDRHLKLRLACAVNGRSAQLLVTDALDAFLGAMPELDAMAANANRKGQ